jgi:hypothetical protein
MVEHQTFMSTELAPLWRSVLVVAERNIIAGGLLRFLRMHRAIQPFGTQLSFAFDDLTGPWLPQCCEVLPIVTAMSRKWDATILPGAGFSESFLEGLDRFCTPMQGTRVQAVLNDQTKREQFLRANKVFDPHSVIFNNRDWTPGSYSHFQGDRFAVVEGAVDCAQFAPAIAERGAREGAFVVGLQSKYVTELGGIAPLLPPTVRFRVMRADLPAMLPQGLADLVQADRLEFVGLVAEADLPAFYLSCDCILHLESFAGWANIVAEAMACGIPVVCSAAGTAAIAEHGVTALVVSAQDLSAVAAAITAVQADPDAARVRARQARSRILGFGWEAYGSAFLAAARDDGRKHYLHAPEYGLMGKWPMVSRLEDIEPLLPFANGADVLDIGCAEGLIAKQLFVAGAKSVHGVDIDDERIVTARYICAQQYKNAVFKIDSVTPWPDFVTRNALLLRASYDIVLYLAVHQHLEAEHRNAVLIGLIGLATRAFAIRMPDALFSDEGIDACLRASGFDEHTVGGSTIGGAGRLRIYVKRKGALCASW